MSEQAKTFVPKLRFPDFKTAGEWGLKSIDECLDYLQPTPYLVADTNYNDSYKTPVLTAGKTFILGYTNEVNGVFEDKLPVIIFDDFTTSTQFVDFPFKAKSSAMKILIEKNSANIKFMYELLQMVQFEVGAHERHWISTFAPMQVLVPKPKEQQKIADCLASLDELITAQNQKVEALKQHKKGLMQQLFLAEGETVPKLRFPEFENDGGWSSEKLGSLIDTVTPPQKLQTNQYQLDGKYPIFDQSQSYICGWTDNKDALVKDNLPLIIFGDHTCALKIAYTPFVQGADGIKILQTKKEIETQFLYQILQFQPVVMEEYKRHFSILKEKVIFYPDKDTGEQKKIAGCLSSLDDLITAQNQKVEALKQHKKGLMQQLFPAIADLETN